MKIDLVDRLKITLTLQECAQKYGVSILREFEGILSSDRKHNINLNIPIISLANDKVNDFSVWALKRLGVYPPYNDIYLLEIESVQKFWTDWEYFERILKLKAFS
jgi:hypothetical protein